MGLLFAGLAGGMAGFGKGLAQVSEDEAKRQLEAERAAAEEMRQERLARLNNSLNEASNIKLEGIRHANTMEASDNDAVNRENAAIESAKRDEAQSQRDYNRAESAKTTDQETEDSRFVNAKTGQPLTVVELQMAKDAGMPVQAADAYNDAHAPVTDLEKSQAEYYRAKAKDTLTPDAPKGALTDNQKFNARMKIQDMIDDALKNSTDGTIEPSALSSIHTLQKLIGDPLLVPQIDPATNKVKYAPMGAAPVRPKGIVNVTDYGVPAANTASSANELSGAELAAKAGIAPRGKKRTSIFHGLINPPDRIDE